tara:strand:+ start:29435 stop:31222 length:1788 start_codon:yes stop_codon:yes gene_type:complete
MSNVFENTIKVDASGNATVDGNLTVNGTTTTIDTVNLTIKDKLIELANGTTGTPSGDAGIIIERGSSTNAAMLWDETRDEFVFATTSATGGSTGDLTFTPANLSVERIGAGTEQAEVEVHAKRDAGSGVQYSTTATIVSEDDSRPSIQLAGSANNIGLIQFGDNAAAASGQVYYDHSTDKLRIDAGGNSDRLTVDSDGDIVVAGDAKVTGDIIIDDGGSLKEAGGTAAFTFDGSGNVTKIGQDSMSSGDVLTWDGAKFVGESPTTGDITGVTAGVGLSGGGTSGAVTLTLDLSELNTVTPADGDFFATLDSDGSNEQKTTTTALATLFAGTGLTASSSVIGVDASQTQITSVGTIGTGTWQGTAIASAYLDADTAHLSGTQTFSGAKTFSADVVISGTTPQLTIGDAGAEDTMLVFDGNAVDFRIGLDDGTDTLEIGKGSAHGTTPAIKVDSNVNVQIMHNSAVADGEFSGDVAVFQAGEDLTAGEVVYFKSDGKCWKAVATAAATSRCVAMATATISANAFGAFLLKGFARFDSEFPTWTIGGALFTPEAETSSKNVPEQAAPDSDGDFVQILGYAISGDAIYFNPDSTVVEVA